MDCTLSLWAYLAMQLGHGLTLFADALNIVVCPLLGQGAHSCHPREAAEWCQMLMNEPKDKPIVRKIVATKVMTQHQVSGC